MDFVGKEAQALFEGRYWTKRYPPGIEAALPPSPYASVLDVLQHALRDFAQRPAFVSAGVAVTYREVDELSNRFAAYLHSIGVKAQDVVAIMLPNCVQFPVCCIGALKLGCRLTLINPLYTVRELSHQLKDSGAMAVVVFENFGKTVEQSLEGTQVQHIVTTQLGDLLGVKGHAINFLMRYVKKLVPKYHLPQAVSMKSALSTGKQQGGYPHAKPQLNDVLMLQYTGGTTGVSKGAMLTHRNVLSNIEQLEIWKRVVIGTEPITLVTLLPLYHIYALVVNGFLFMTLGARNILIANPRDVPTVLKVLRNERFHVFTAVNTLFNAFLNNAEFCQRDFSDLKLVLSGGMALQKPIAKQWFDVTGCPISEGYGLTETSPVVTAPPLHGEPLPVFRGCVGLPLPGTEVRIRRNDGLWGGVNEVGEVCVRGPQVMLGYLNRPDDTAQVLDAQGWLATGDIGTMDEEGFLRIVDRKKDMIIVSGFNVFPNEVEDIVAQHPDVLECAVVGVPDPLSGERVKLVVVKKRDTLTQDELIAHCRQQLTGYKVPSIVVFCEDLPKTTVGKVLRRALREAV